MDLAVLLHCTGFVESYRFVVIANEKTLHKKPNDTEINHLIYLLQQLLYLVQNYQDFT